MTSRPRGAEVNITPGEWGECLPRYSTRAWSMRDARPTGSLIPTIFNGRHICLHELLSSNWGTQAPAVGQWVNLRGFADITAWTADKFENSRGTEKLCSAIHTGRAETSWSRFSMKDKSNETWRADMPDWQKYCLLPVMEVKNVWKSRFTITWYGRHQLITWRNRS